MKIASAVFLSTLLASVIHPGEQNESNTKAILSPMLRDCYASEKFRNRNNLQPMTLPVFIDLLRKIEDFPGSVANMRQISAGILHTLRQDGIEYDPSIPTSESVIPYKPTSFQAYKNRLLLRKLLPNNLFAFPNESLTVSEKCTLHHMISSTIAMHTRGDEGMVCPNLVRAVIDKARYRTNSNSIFSVELLDMRNFILDKSTGNLIMGTSLCPIEDGVIYTDYGTLSAGIILAGVASGLENQKVLVTDLVQLPDNVAVNESFVVDNKYASTLAGDLAEASLRQGVAAGQITLGAPGSWNSTLRKQYFLDRSENLELTNAEIIAGIDGLVLSDLAGHYVELFPELKLSQFIDMYYSKKGIFHEQRFRACNRQMLTLTVAPVDLLAQEATAFGLALNEVMPMTGSLMIDGISAYCQSAANQLYGYVAQSITEAGCPTENIEQERPKINLILVVDISLSIYPYIHFILDGIELGKYGSCVTLLDPSSGEIVIEKTCSSSTFHEKFIDLVDISGFSSQVQLPSILQSIFQLNKDNLVEEKIMSYVGGNSSAVLVLVNNIPLNTDKHLESIDLATTIRNQMPDSHIIFATSSTSRDYLQNIVSSPSYFIPIDLSNFNASSHDLSLIVDILKSIPKRIINPSCGLDFQEQIPNNYSFYEYLDADGISLYRVHPQYFFQNQQNRRIVIQSPDDTSINVCHSRSNTYPRRNRTSSQVPDDVTCVSVTGGQTTSIALDTACSGYGASHLCPPLFFTLSVNTASRTPTCSDYSCRYPNDLKILISVEEFGCFSNAFRLNFTVWIICLSISFVFGLK